MTRFATLNVGRNGIVKSPQVRGVLIQSRIQICAFQEIDINTYSRINYVSQWKSLGYFVALGCPSPQNQCVRVALISSSKLKQIWLPEISLCPIGLFLHWLNTKLLTVTSKNCWCVPSMHLWRMNKQQFTSLTRQRVLRQV